MKITYQTDRHILEVAPTGPLNKDNLQALETQINHAKRDSSCGITKSRNHIVLLAGLVTSIGLAGCEKNPGTAKPGLDAVISDEVPPMALKKANEAEESLREKPAAAVGIFSGKASGTVKLMNKSEGVTLTGQIQGLQPGEHGFHIHEKGDCSAADFSSAGGHFNPNDSIHGAPDDAEHHVGDLGNITADAKGWAPVEVLVPGATFSGPHGILGRALVVHQKADDMESQPSGAAGSRVGCAVSRNTDEKRAGAHFYVPIQRCGVIRLRFLPSGSGCKIHFFPAVQCPYEKW